MSAAAHMLLADTNIKIGEHHTVSVFGITLNADTIWCTVAAGVVVIALGLLVARSASGTNPGRLQLLWEMLVNWVTGQVQANLGTVNPFVVPLAVALFAFILIANWLELIPTGSGEWLISPTADVNLTYALSLLVIVGVHVYSVRQRGLRGYLAHYTKPYKALLPILVIEELVKPFTLALRLFGNIFSGGIMLAIIALLPTWVLWGPNGAWKLFDAAIGVIQAFIFALLTILYFGMAGETHDEGHEGTPHDKIEPAGEDRSPVEPPPAREALARS